MECLFVFDLCSVSQYTESLWDLGSAEIKPRTRSFTKVVPDSSKTLTAVSAA